MPQIELFEIQNPCINVCQTAKNGYCIGCLRSRAERQDWYKMSDDEKHKVLKLLSRRHAKIKKLAYENATQKTQMELVFFEKLWTTPDLFE